VDQVRQGTGETGRRANDGQVSRQAGRFKFLIESQVTVTTLRQDRSLVKLLNIVLMGAE